MVSAVTFGQQNTFHQTAKRHPQSRSNNCKRQPIRLETIDETPSPDSTTSQNHKTCRANNFTTFTMDDHSNIKTVEDTVSQASRPSGRSVPAYTRSGLAPLSTATNACARYAYCNGENNTAKSSALISKTSSLSSFLARIPESQKFSSTTLSSRKSTLSLPKVRPTVRVDSSLDSTQSLRLSSHSFPITALETILRSTNAQFRLALMLAVPWRTAAFWSVTGSTLGCFYVARLLLPRLRLYAVFLGRELASLLAANTDGAPNATTWNATILQPLQPNDQLSGPVAAGPSQAALRRAWLSVLTVVTNSASTLNSSSLQNKHSTSSPSGTSADSTAISSSVQLPSTPRTVVPRTPERFLRSPDLWDSPASSIMDTRFEGCESPTRIDPTSSANSPSRSRANSGLGAVHTKRFSLNFPIHAPNGQSPRPPSWHASPILSPEILASPTESNFLTTLAAQERRVLELKDELRRAEEELDRLKRHWAKHEVSKAGKERQSIPLQPLKTNFVIAASKEDDAQPMQRDIERRKTLMSGQRQSNRRIFSGSRHTRTLSLLSPDKGYDPQSFTDSPFKKPVRNAPERTITSPDIKTGPAISSDKEDLFADLTGVPREAILRTGKQMVGDIKDGFWTFFEDIRQATVGNEPINGASSVRMTSTINPRQHLARSKSQRLPVAHDKKLARHSTALITSTQPRAGSQMTYDASPNPNGSFWRENGVESPESTRSRSTVTTVRLAPNTPTPPERKDSDEAWDMWGTPIRLGNKHGASHSLSSTNTNATHAHRSDSPSSATSEYEMSKTTSTGASSPTNTTMSTPEMSHFDGQTDNALPKQIVKTVDNRTIKRAASSLLPDWERVIAKESRKADKED